MKKLIIALSLVASTNAFAIGKTEKGVLIGVGSTILLGSLLENRDHDSQYYPSNPSGDFPPFRCTKDTIECAYQRGKWEREREEWLAAKDRAYICGRYPEKCQN